MVKMIQFYELKCLKYNDFLQFKINLTYKKLLPVLLNSPEVVFAMIQPIKVFFFCSEGRIMVG